MQQLFDHRYEKIELLGRGTFGEVWKVVDTETDKVEALKIYTSASDQDTKNMIIHEFGLLADVNHPNLLTPRHYSISDPEGYPYLVLKYCDKGNISQLVGQFDELRAWCLLRDMASALACLHSKQPAAVIHQDIKPENILLDGENFMLSDFGVSTQAKAINIATGDIEDSLRSAGTIAYMAPEKFDKNSIPIMANDIWSLGATIFEMLSGQLPFGINGGMAQSADTPIPDMKGSYSSQLKQIISRCLAYKTKERPFAKDIAKMAQDAIEEIRGGTIVTPPRVITNEASPLNITLLSAACFAGLVIGIALAFIF
jgi:serine/threonine protein kinase